MTTNSIASIVLFLAANIGGAAHAADENRLFEAANIASGKTLHSEKHCSSCHLQREPKGEQVFYTRLESKVTSREKLIAQVEACNTSLGLGMFPEETLDIAAWLNKTYYKLK
jgi:hypothetical protein